MITIPVPIIVFNCMTCGRRIPLKRVFRQWLLLLTFDREAWRMAKNREEICEACQFKKARSTCSVCGSSKLEVRNHSAIWGDGDLYCENNHYVRMFDSG